MERATARRLPFPAAIPPLPFFSGDRSGEREEGELRNRRADVYNLGRILPRVKVCLPSSSGGGALSRRGGDDFDSVRRWTEEVGFLLLRLLFPLLAVVVAGVEAEWILVLWVDPGELQFFGSPCEVGGGPLGSRMDLLGCPFFSAVAVRGCLSCALELLDLWKEDLGTNR